MDDCLKNLTFRMRSYIACDELQCPVIRERLEHHILSHNSTSTPSKASLRTINVPMITSDEHTSTSDINEMKNSKKPSYREALEREIRLWAKDLPKYSRQSTENLKRNIISELTEKFFRLRTEINDSNYDAKLSREISNFLGSLPPTAEMRKRDLYPRDPPWVNLKEGLVDRINELNRKTINKKRSSSSSGNEIRNMPKNRSSSTNTTKTKKWKGYMPQSIATNTSNSSSSERHILKPINRSKLQNKKRTGKQLKRESDQDVMKDKMSTWMSRVITKSTKPLEEKDKKVLTEVLYNRLRPLLAKQFNSENDKAHLKEEILNFLHDYFRVAVDNNGVYFNKLDESLATTLLLEKKNQERTHSGRNSSYSYYCTDQNMVYKTKTECYFKPIVYNIVKDALENCITCSESVEQDITEILLHNIDQIRDGGHQNCKEDLHIILKSSTDLVDYTISNIISVIMDQLSYVLCHNTDDYNSIKKINRSPWSDILSVYKSELELCSSPIYPIMSLQRYSNCIKRNEPKIKPEEKAYKDFVYALVADWVEILPRKLNKVEDTIIKETITNSLVIDILDQVKLEEIAPEKCSEKEKYFSFFIYRWLNRFDYFNDINNAKPCIDKLMNKLINIPVYDCHQMKINNKFIVMTACSQATLKHEDIIENEISKIINVQPSIIFINADKEIRKQQVHEFAYDVQNSLEEKNSSKHNITNDIIQWLKIMIKPEVKEYLNLLKDQLSGKINSLLPAWISDYQNQDRINEIKDLKNEIITPSPCCESNDNNTYEPENQLKEFISKYMEHNYDVENSIAREAFSHIFKIELQKLSTPTNAKYDNFPCNKQCLISTPESISKELKYINIISDWLRILPLPASFNRIGNKPRIEFLNGLAKNINDVEESRFIHFTGREYNVYLASIINKYAEQWPMSKYDKKNMSAMVDDLVWKILQVRHSTCCQNENCKNDISSTSSTNIPEELSRIIEDYINDNYEELSEDELKLEALSARLFKEIIKLRSENQGSNKLHKLGESGQHLSQNNPVTRLSFELCYAKEISECLNNLPLLSITDKASKELRVKMISNLAERMYEYKQDKNDDPSNIYLDTDLSNYITLWISEHSLDTSKEIDEAIVKQQLLNRMDRVNKRELKKIQASQHTKKATEMCESPYTCCNIMTVSSQKRQDPGVAIVEAIEKWCAELPIETEKENTDNAIKDNVATKLYKKIGELNMNPKCFSDNNLYRELLSVEIDTQLGFLPQNSKLETMKQDLKQQLLSSIMKKRIEMREQASSTEYKQELEITIELSLPNPVKKIQDNSPGFKIYKDRLATMFILENFDHGYGYIKENYKKSIKKEIDKYCQYAQKRNAIPLSKDQIYNELYSALYSVPHPNRPSIQDEVEEIKTRCEIDNWFETLPLRVPSSTDEVLAEHQILAMLAKRIHRFEKNEQTSDSEIYKEITKWILRFSFLPDQENNIDEFAHKLLQKLKSTTKHRKCIQRHGNVPIDKFVKYKNKTMGKGILSTSQIAGPSSEYKIRPSPACCQITSPPGTKPADLIFNIVEAWCQELPLPSNTFQGAHNIKFIRDNLVTKIIMKISELSVNHETLNNDYLYDALLDEELENLLSTLPTSNDFSQTKQLKKNQLKDAIKAVKPFIKKEKAKYEYKKELQSIVDIFLTEPQNTAPKIRALYMSLKDQIIDNFIVYNYHKNDEDGILYKILVNVAVDKYFTEVNEDKNMLHDSLMVGNHLVCEMAKVPVPSETAILEEIKEIRIKIEITEFFNNLSLCNSNNKLLRRNQIISTVAKRVSELAKGCFTPDYHCTVKNEINKCLKKLDENVDLEKVDVLVERIINLPETEASVKTVGFVNPLPLTDDEKCYQTPAQHQRFSKYDKDNENTDNGQWMSLLSVTPKAHGSHYNETNMAKLEDHPEDGQTSQYNRQGEHDMRGSKLNYSDFNRGVALTSSVRESQEPIDFALAPRSYTSASDHPKLVPYISSNQDSELVQSISLQRSSSLNKSINKVPSCQKSIQPYSQPNQAGQKHSLPDYENQAPSEIPSSSSDNGTKQFPLQSLQNQTSQDENLKPLEKTHQHIPQKFRQQVSQSVPQQMSQQGTSSQEKNQTPQSNTQKGDKLSLIRKSKMSKTLIQFRKVGEPSPSRSSNVQITPTRRLISDTNVSRGKRRPSILFLNSSDVKSESINSSVQCSPTDENLNNLSTECLPSHSENGNEVTCKCGNKIWKRPVRLIQKNTQCCTCSDFSPPYCHMPQGRYPEFYFY